MFNGKRLECDSTNLRARTLLDHVAIFDRVKLQFLPRLLRRIHRTGRAAFQSPRVIGMRVREHNRARIDAFEFPQPIKTAIDHHVCIAIRYQQRRVHAMPPRPCLDLAACAEERQHHWKRLVFLFTGRDSLRRARLGAQAADCPPYHCAYVCLVGRVTPVRAAQLTCDLLSWPTSESTIMETRNRSPRIKHVSWGRLEVEGKAELTKMQNFFPAARVNGTGARQEQLTIPAFK